MKRAPVKTAGPVRVTPKMRKDRAIVVAFFATRDALRELAERAKDRNAIVTTGEVQS